MSKAFIEPGETILLIGDTGDGKTAQIGELAEHLKITTGLGSRIYTADSGRAWRTVAPHEKLGIIDVVELLPTDDPHVWLNNAVQGNVRSADGKGWVPGKPVAMNAFEGFTSIGGRLMDHVAKQAAHGQHKGGEERFVLNTGVGKVASNNRTDYNLVQLTLRDRAQQSMMLNSVIVWTAALSRAQDEGMTTVLGPLLVGSAMSAIAPMWFQYTFRVAAFPTTNTTPRHVLYLEDHVDSSAGSAKGLGNARVPLAGRTAVPFSIEPASIVKALEQLKKRGDEAVEEIAKRVGITVAK